MRNIIATLLMGACLYCIYTTSFFMDSADMEPTIKDKAYCIVNPYAYASAEPKIGDIILFQTLKMDKPAMKRIIACDGDTISIEDGLVIRNDRILKEPYAQTSGNASYPLTTIPSQSFFVLNDNRDQSFDSRSTAIGMLKRENILGKVIMTL